MERQGKFVPSQLGKSLFECQNYLYNKVRTNRDKTIYWQCKRRYGPERCNVHVKCNEQGEVLGELPDGHHHETEALAVEIQVRSRVLQEAVLRHKASPAALINENVGLRLAIEFPTESAMKKAIERRKSKLIPQNPKSVIEIIIVLEQNTNR